MSESTTMIRKENELQVKQIAISAILTAGAAVIAGTTIWTFLQGQFAPNRLTAHQIAEQERHITRLEEQVAELQKENQDLRIWFEQIKAGRN